MWATQVVEGIVHPISNNGLRCLYGSGAAKVAATVNKEGGNLSLQDAQEVINQYFETFSRLKKWLTETQGFIKENGFIYSFFGRKRRLPNVFSSDRGIAGHEVRSGVNSVVQSACSDVNLLAAMDTYKEVKKLGLDANIFMLVHDSIVAIVKNEDVEEFCNIMQVQTQKDRGCSIPGFPIGVDQEVGQDYSFGKFDKVFSIEDGCLVKN